MYLAGFMWTQGLGYFAYASKESLFVRRRVISLWGIGTRIIEVLIDNKESDRQSPTWKFVSAEI